MSQTIVVFGSSSLEKKHPTFQEGILLGSMIANHGFKVLSGGYEGIMGAVSQGAAEAGGEAVGITSKSFFFREGPNPWLTQHIEAEGTVDRLKALINGADAAIAMPGNIGTLNEIIMVLTLWKTKEIAIPMIVWREPFFQALNNLSKLELIPSEFLSKLIFVDNPTQAIEGIKKFL